MEPKAASPPEPFAGEDHFCQDKCTRFSPSKWPIVGALPTQYLGRGPEPLYIGLATTVEGGEFSLDREAIELIQAVHRTSSRTPLARLFILVLFIISP